jgi:CubicO group peptidase (beta-lactamase class C family)
MGEYDGQQIISRNVMEEYSRVQFPENNNRRGLGFDKPLLNNALLSQKDTYPTKGASPESFGHSGYTGTFVWVDPVHEISIIPRGLAAGYTLTLPDEDNSHVFMSKMVDDVCMMLGGRAAEKKETVLKPWQGNRSQFIPHQYSNVRRYFTSKKAVLHKRRS